MNSTTRQALLARLGEHPQIDAAHLWFTHAPDDAPLPVVLLTLENDRRLLSHSGPVGLAEADLSVDIWAVNTEAALTLREAALEQLHGFCGEVSIAKPGGGSARAEITHCIHESSSEGFDAGNALAHAGASFAVGYHC